MLTEYSTYDDIRKFRDKAVAKSEAMMTDDGFLRLIGRKMTEWSLHRRENRSPLIRAFDVDWQKVEFLIMPNEDNNGNIIPFSVFSSLSVCIETRKGRSVYEFLPDMIAISSPHFVSRCRERSRITRGAEIAQRKPYIRDGRKYELLTFGENVVVCRRPEPDIVIYITFLNKDMCQSRNFRAIFAQIDKDIDEHDIYVWK